MKKQEWFASWFDTPFYHILYKNRSFEEAEKFITKLLTHLNPPKTATILDLACGKGRHAFFIAKDNYKVTGVDLSAQSIEWAKENYKLTNLNFDVHDMRKIYKANTFDYVFNFFTSFGYFEDDNENQAVVNGMAENLKNEGLIVIDYLNIYKDFEKMIPAELKVIDGIEFCIHKKLENNFFVKRIEFKNEGKNYNFEERVQALNLDNFKTYFKNANLELVEVFGNYNLDAFDKESAERLIMIVKKNA